MQTLSFSFTVAKCCKIKERAVSWLPCLSCYATELQTDLPVVLSFEDTLLVDMAVGANIAGWDSEGSPVLCTWLFRALWS